MTDDTASKERGWTHGQTGGLLPERLHKYKGKHKQYNSDTCVFSLVVINKYSTTECIKHRSKKINLNSMST
jgi:hypothetical protein